MSFEQFYLVELRLFVSIGITNQNKNGFFHCFCLSSSIHPLCVTTSPGHTPGPAPLLPLPTKLIPLDAPSSPSQCPAQTRVQCSNSSTSATPAWGVSEWGANPGNTPQVAGGQHVAMWLQGPFLSTHRMLL